MSGTHVSSEMHSVIFGQVFVNYGSDDIRLVFLFSVQDGMKCAFHLQTVVFWVVTSLNR
jgi:hypothetical protein